MPDDVLDLYRRCIPRGQARAGRVAGAVRRLDGRQGPVGGRPSAATACPAGRRALPTFGPEDGPMATRKAIKACLDATGESIPGLMPGSGRPDRQHRDGHGRRRGPVGRGAGREPHPLRHPRARDGRGHDRDGRPPGHRCRWAAPSSCSATTCAARCGWPRSPTSTSSTRGPTTRSVWARTVPPTSPSSSWPPCGPCPASG